MSLPADQHAEPAAPLRTPWRPSIRLALAFILAATVLAMGSLVFSDFAEVDDPQNIVLNIDFNPPTLSGVVKHWTQAKLGLYIPVMYTVWHAIAFVSHSQTANELGQHLAAEPFKVLNLLLLACCDGVTARSPREPPLQQREGEPGAARQQE
jgi:hypothetical protein